MEHSIHPELLRRRVCVLAVGCGGTGSAIVGGLSYLHLALVANGHFCRVAGDGDGWGHGFSHQLGTRAVQFG